MKKRAFTLAEVLITLGIIGVVAAMTIPALSTKIREVVMVNKLKKFYSTMGQAVKLNMEQNPGNFYSFERFADVFAIKTICTGNDTSCAPERYKNLSGGATSWGVSDSFRTGTAYAQMADGSILRYTHNVNGSVLNDCSFSVGDTEMLSSVCAEVSVDLNGNKQPNTLGKDVFYFYVTSYGLIPYGAEGITSQYGSSASCKTSGHGCTAYVLKYGTLDYSKNNF